MPSPLKHLVLSLILLFPAFTTAATPPPIHTLTPEQASQDVALARRALEMIHPGLYRYTLKPEIDRAFAQLEDRTHRPIADLEFYGQISLLLAQIHCDHTKAELPAAMESYRNTNPTHLPFRFVLFDGRMYVFSSDPNQTTLPRGTEIVSINAVPITKLLATLSPAVSYDGLTSAVIPTKLSSDSDLMGSDFDQFYPSFFGLQDHFILELRSTDATTTRKVTLQAISFKHWIDLPSPDGPYHAEFYRETTWRMLDKKTAYLRIGTFVNYRHPVDAEAFYAAYFKAINASGAEHLILDLRDNGGGGGSSDPSTSLIPFLLDRPFLWNKPILMKAIRFGELPQYITTWGDPKELFEAPVENFTHRSDGWYERVPGKRETYELPMKPNQDRFRGRVTILTGPSNASGSTMVIAKLKDANRVRTVGLPTGGSAEGPTAGRIFFLKLPNSGITIRVPNFWNRMSIATFRPGYGIEPDLRVEPTLADLLAGKDITLEAARKELPSATPSPISQSTTITSLFTGDWQGQLEYRDFSAKDDSSKRVALPTVLHVTPHADGALDFDYLFDDGPGKIVEDISTITIDPKASTYRASSPGDAPDDYTITGLSDLLANGKGTLILSGIGTENGSAVRVRQTIDMTANSFVVTRETAKPNADFLFRHRYTFTRTIND